jgi:hypothetical protein
VQMGRNFEPMRKQVEAWQRSELTDVTAKVVIYEAFVEGKLEAPKHLAAMSMIFTSSRSMRSSENARSGVSRTHSPRHSRNSNQFPSSRRPRNWEGSWKAGSRNRSSKRAALGGGQTLLGTDLAEARSWMFSQNRVAEIAT